MRNGNIGHERKLRIETTYSYFGIKVGYQEKVIDQKSTSSNVSTLPPRYNQYNRGNGITKSRLDIESDSEDKNRLFLQQVSGDSGILAIHNTHIVEIDQAGKTPEIKFKGLFGPQAKVQIKLIRRD
jgi:hypothetical protein